MWFEDLSIWWNKDIFTIEEIHLAKKYIEKYKTLLRSDFDSTIEENEIKMEKFSSNEVICFLLKAIIMMKKNWAKTIDDLDKIHNIEETGTSLDIVQKEVKDKVYSHSAPINVKKTQETNLVDILKEANNNWLLDVTIDLLISTVPTSDSMKENMKNELYLLAKS